MSLPARSIDPFLSYAKGIVVSSRFLLDEHIRDSSPCELDSYKCLTTMHVIDADVELGPDPPCDFGVLKRQREETVRVSHEFFYVTSHSLYPTVAVCLCDAIARNTGGLREIRLDHCVVNLITQGGGLPSVLNAFEGVKYLASIHLDLQHRIVDSTTVVQILDALTKSQTPPTGEPSIKFFCLDRDSDNTRMGNDEARAIKNLLQACESTLEGAKIQGSLYDRENLSFIVDGLVECSRIKSLELCFSAFTSTAIAELRRFFDVAKSLTHLDCGFCEFPTQRTLRSFFNALHLNASLVVLELTGLGILGRRADLDILSGALIAEALKDLLKNHPRLEYLELVGNKKFGDACSRKLVESLGESRSFGGLTLGHSSFSITSMMKCLMARGPPAISHLLYLGLATTPIGVAGADAIARLVSNPSCALRTLSFWKTVLDDESLHVLVSGLQQNRTLKVLSLKNSTGSITDQGWISLASILPGFTTLQKMTLTHTLWENIVEKDELLKQAYLENVSNNHSLIEVDLTFDQDWENLNNKLNFFTTRNEMSTLDVDGVSKLALWPAVLSKAQEIYQGKLDRYSRAPANIGPSLIFTLLKTCPEITSRCNVASRASKKPRNGMAAGEERVPESA